LNGDEQTRKETDEQQETNKPIKPTTNFTLEDKKALTKKEMMSKKSKSDLGSVVGLINVKNEEVDSNDGTALG